jgi:hypothetical protein
MGDLKQRYLSGRCFFKIPDDITPPSDETEDEPDGLKENIECQ